MKRLDWFLRMASGRSDLLLVVMLLATIFMMILPMRPVMMDVLQATNLTISTILLMVAVYIRSPLAFVSFPSILLLTTLLRLALGIAATRMILLEANAGDIIQTFGNFVVAGNLIVGAVVFLLITIVQFMVITKGSERVAEVAARFSLDAMPGKQMSIDGDMRAGVIDMEEARRRRALVEKESQLYGAMDGAMKFVKGDAIAGLICIFVNLLGGLAIGTLQQGMPAVEAMSVYSVLTIGDGLVSQIPSLLTSMTAGFIVTRVTSEQSTANLGDEIGGEITAQPKALLVGSFILVLFSIVPGFPTPIFLALAMIVGGGGYALRRRALRPASPASPFAPGGLPSMAASGSPAPARKSKPGETDDFSLTVPLMVDIGSGVETAIKAELLNDELARIRQALYFDLGVPFPGIGLRINEGLRENGYTILIHEVPCGEGTLKPGCLFVRETIENLRLIGVAGEEGKPFLPRIPTIWVDGSAVRALGDAGVPYMEPVQVLAYHISQIMRRYADEFIGIQEARFLLMRMEEKFPELVKEVQRILSLQKIAEVLQRLVSEGVSVRNLRAITTALIDWGQKEKDSVLLTEHVRGALRRQICYRHSAGLNMLPAYVVAPEVEDLIRNAIRQTASGSYLALDPRQSRQISEKVRQVSLNASKLPHKPVLITAMDIRRYLRKIIENECQDLSVLSYQELTPEITVQPLARVTL